jgi:hypothetical protein
MKNLAILAASLALALAAPAFAQDSSQTTPASQASDQAASSDSQSMDSGAKKPASHHRVKHHASNSSSQYSPAAMALTGDDAKTAAYQASDRQKAYPAVDHGHVPGDPPIIDHSGDQASVATPTHTTITVPPPVH